MKTPLLVEVKTTPPESSVSEEKPVALETPPVSRPSGYPATTGPRLTVAEKLQAWRRRVLEDKVLSADLRCYVPPNGQSASQSTHSEPLQAWVEQEFLQSEARVLLLQGPGGAGKSTFNRHCLRRLWQDPAWAEWKPGAAPPQAAVPVWIALGSAAVDPKRLLASLQALPEASESLTDEELNVLKSDYRLVLIADGYDELPNQSRVNLYDANRLDRYAGRVKLLISSRVLEERSGPSTAPFVPHRDGGGIAEYRYYRERYLSPFNAKQIADYLTQYLAQNKDRTDITIWPTVKQYQEHFHALPELQSLITSPFLLWITAEALPVIVQAAEQSPATASSVTSLEAQEKDLLKEPEKTTEKEKAEAKQEAKEDTETQDSTPLPEKVAVSQEPTEFKFASPGLEDLLTDSAPTPESKKPVIAPRVRSERLKITRLKLYEEFMTQWFQRQAEKAAEAKDFLADPVAFLGTGSVPEATTNGDSGEKEARSGIDDLQQAYRLFCRVLAQRLQMEGRVSVAPPKRRGGLSRTRQPATTAASGETSSWVVELFGSSGGDWERIRKGCPLKRSETGEYQFLHASLIDYFVATETVAQATAVLAEAAVETEKVPPTLPMELLPASPPTVSPIPSSELVAMPLSTSESSPVLPQEISPAPASPPVPKPARRRGRLCRAEEPNPLTQRLQTADTLGFLVDELKAHPGRSDYYDQLIERSKMDRTAEAGFAAANAATILSWSGADLMNRDWRGVQLRGANLRRANLAHTELEGADLRGACLARAVLYGVNLEQADLRETTWDELPRLEYKEEVHAVAYHPTEPWLAVAKGDVIEIRHWGTRDVLKTLTGHTDWVLSVTFSPNGRWLASGSVDETVRLWEVSSGELRGAPLTGHTDWVLSVAFSPDGRWLASGSGDRTVRLWDVSSGELRGEPLTEHRGVVRSVTFSPNSCWLASGNQDSTVRVWSVARGKAIGAPLTGHEDSVQSVTFSSDGRWLASGSWDKAVRVWDVGTGESRGELLTGHSSKVQSVAFSPDGRWLASGGLDKTVRLWDVSNGKLQGAPLTGHTEEVLSVMFSPDGRWLASGSRDNTVRLWDVSNGELRGAPLTGHTEEVLSVTFSPDGRWLAFGRRHTNVRLWDVSNGELRGAPLTGHTEEVNSVMFSPDGRLAFIRHTTLQLWDVSSGELRGASLTGHLGSVNSVTFSPDGRWLASGGLDGTVRLWDVSSGELRGEPLTEHRGAVLSVTFSPDGRWLASGGLDKTVRVWSVARGKAIGAPLTGHTEEVNSVMFSPDGRWLASGSADRTVRLWDVSSGELRGEPLTEHRGVVLSVTFSPDGRWLASGGLDKTVRVWSVARGKAIGAPLTGHTESVTSVSYSPDGRWLASGSQDQTVRMWDVASGRCVGLLQWMFRVRAVAFSPAKESDSTLTAGDFTLAIGDDGGQWSLWQMSAADKSAIVAERSTQAVEAEAEASEKEPEEESEKEKSFSGTWTRLAIAPPRLWKFSRNVNSTLWAANVRLTGCRLETATQLLLQQQGADGSGVVIAEMSEEKSGLSSGLSVLPPDTHSGEVTPTPSGSRVSEPSLSVSLSSVVSETLPEQPESAMTSVHSFSTPVLTAPKVTAEQPLSPSITTPGSGIEPPPSLLPPAAALPVTASPPATTLPSIPVTSGSGLVASRLRFFASLAPPPESSPSPETKRTSSRTRPRPRGAGLRAESSSSSTSSASTGLNSRSSSGSSSSAQASASSGFAPDVALSSLKSSSPVSSLTAPHAQLFTPPAAIPSVREKKQALASPGQHRIQGLITQARELLDAAYPDSALKQSEAYSIHALRLSAYEKHSETLSLTDQRDLQELISLLTGIRDSRQTLQSLPSAGPG